MSRGVAKWFCRCSLLGLLGSVALLAVAGCLVPDLGSDEFAGQVACEDVQKWYPTGELAPAWSPSGERIVAFVGYAPNGEFSPGIYLTNLRTRAWKKIVSTTAFRSPSHSLWHPSADRVLISYDPGADILDLASGSLQALSDANGQGIYLARWSPEGDSIWYSRTGGMHVMAATGGTPRLFLPSTASFRPAGDWSFSPDGRTIAYAHAIQEDDGTYRYRNEIRLIGRDGQGVRQLTYLNGNAMHPLWIHGGREVMFDWADSICVNSLSRPERTWLSVDVVTGRIRRLGGHLGSMKFQFSFNLAVDTWGDRAVVVAGERDRELGTYGVLHTTWIERPLLLRLFQPGSPQLP